MNTILITNSIENSKNFICTKLQEGWSRATNDDRRKSEYNFLKENKNFRIITNKSQFYDFDFKTFTPEIIFIIPELLWENDGVNEGYSIARELITHNYKDEFIQLAFISVLDKNILSTNADKRNIGFINAFPHISLLDENYPIQFSYYSEIHYKLIKFLAISDQGRIQKIDHEISPIKSNATSDPAKILNEKDNLLKLLEELSLFQAWTSENINILIERVTNEQDVIVLKGLVKKTEDIILEIKNALPENNNHRIEKSNYNVLIIEDQKQYRQLLYEVFSKHYVTVYPDNQDEILIFKYNQKLKPKSEPFSISNAIEIIKTQCKKYQIIILDLLYKDNDGNWLDFNGLDLYVLVKKCNPTATIRIITSLPREIVAKIIESTIQEKILLNQVFTKRGGDDALRYSVEDRIEEINNECKENAKTKTVLSQFPKTGIFTWTGIPELMYYLLHERKDDYKKYRDAAQVFFNNYLNGKLDKSINGWNKGELSKPAMKSKIVNSYFLEKLPSIMTHRLIVINEALKDESFRVRYEDYIDIIKKISNISQIDKGYFQTKLGFKGRESKVLEKNESYFQLTLLNLFPEETRFIKEELSKNDRVQGNQVLKEVNVDLLNFFVEILCENLTYDNWDELNLDFYPYLDTESIDNGEVITHDKLSNDLTLNQLEEFLLSLLNNYSKHNVDVIAGFATDIGIDSARIKNKTIEFLINNLYTDTREN